LSVIKTEAKRFHQMKRGAGVGAQPYNIARVRGYAWLMKDDLEHGLDEA